VYATLDMLWIVPSGNARETEELHFDIALVHKRISSVGGHFCVAFAHSFWKNLGM